MFSGIVERVSEVVSLERLGTNIKILFRSNISDKLYVDQSISHDGVCLTVVLVDIKAGLYEVCAIRETVLRTSIKDWKKGQHVNIERSLKLDSRLDGHLVYGHVDCQAKVNRIEDINGSHKFWFEVSSIHEGQLIEKGSVCINGVSLTVVDVNLDTKLFSVCIIPYTFEYTSFRYLKDGDSVNIEYDVIGKYIRKMVSKYMPSRH